VVLCLFFCGSFTFANSFNNNVQPLQTLDYSLDINSNYLVADAAQTLPQLNQSTDLVRTYDFTEGESAALEENMGTTSSGVFTINGADSDNPNSIVFNEFSGFVVSKIQTTLNINNVTITGAESTIGSAIYNTASDAAITLNNVVFSSNSTLSQNDALGGAIYSNGKLTLTNTSFSGNYAVSETENKEAKGGAIYARNSVNMIADSDNVVIVDNYTQTSDGAQEDNAIYIDNSSASLNISAVNSGSFSISDSINGASGYNVVLSGDGTGRIGLFNSIYNAAISVSNVDISFADGTVSSHELDNLTIGDNVNFILDADLVNSTADTIISPNGSGTVNISELSILSESSDDTVTLQVLKNSDNLTLNIDKLTSKLVTTTQATMYNDTILAESIALATTETTNDSIAITGYQDTLYALVHDTNPTHMLKNFIFRTDTEYVLTKDLGEMPQESILSIYNLSNSEYGVLNANGHSMFELVNPITSVTLRDITVKNANTSGNGSVASLDNNTASFATDNAVITGNSADGNGGAIYVKNGTVSLNNSTVSNNTSKGDGGAMYITDNAQVEMVNVDFKSNSTEGKGGAIYTDTTVKISAENGSSTFEGNTAAGENNAIYAGSNGEVTLDARNNGSINMNDKISGDAGYKLNITGNSKGNVNINNTVSNANVTLSGSNLNLAKDNLLEGNDFNAKGGTLNLANGEVGSTNFNSLTTSGKTNVKVDVDLANKSMDRVTADSYSNMKGTINVNKMHLLSDATSSTTKILFADSGLKHHVTSPIRTVSYSRVYKYLVSYSPSDGYFTFSRGSGNDASSFNPAIIPTGIAQQTAYMNQLQNYQAAMYHSFTYMMLPKKVRMTKNDNNLYAHDFDDLDGDRYLQKYLAIPEEIKSIWVRPYASFEKIPLKHGPTVSSVNYGTIFGGDSDLIELGHGFKAVYGGYAGYNGNNTSYSNVNSIQQGAVIGGTGNIYKGNFFDTITANVGWMISDNDTAYGTDTINLIMSGFANKMGYNIEINSGKVIIQPSLLMGYTFVHSSNYRTSDGVDIDSEPLHVMHFSPAVKIIGNLANGWQPYATISIMCNFLDKTNFSANTIRLPEMSIDPYVEYGLGIQKRWMDKYSGFAQATVRSGGRRGVSLLFGFRYMIGKIISREHFIVHENLGKKKVLFKERKEAEIEVGSLNTKDKNKTKPSTPYPDGKMPAKKKYSIVNALKKVSRIVFWKYNADVSAKVVNDVYPDGVIMTTLKGMPSGSKNNGNLSSEFKDKDIISGNYKIDNSSDSNLKNKLAKEPDYVQQQTQKPVVQQKPAVQQQAQKPAVQQKPTVQQQAQKPAVQQKSTVQQQTQKPAVQQKPTVQQQAQKPAVQQKPTVQQQIQKPAVQQKPAENNAFPATVVKAPKRNIEIMPINAENKKQLYLNQSRYTKPVKTNNYNDYSIEVIYINF